MNHITHERQIMQIDWRTKSENPGHHIGFLNGRLAGWVIKRDDGTATAKVLRSPKKMERDFDSVQAAKQFVAEMKIG